MRCTDLALGLAGLLLVACGGGSDAPAPGAGPSGSWNAAERTHFSELSPSSLPKPPADVTNRFADDEAAAEFGQKLFFETRFSGKLTDGDNDGTVNALGVRGETGKVSCAGCHVPEKGFVDDRTLGKQISLAAGWGRRKTPSLLDVGQAKLLMWDGRHDTLYNQPFGPIESPVEMNSSRLYVAQQAHALYRAPYEALFGPMPPLDDAQRFPVVSAEQTGCTPSTVDPEPTCNGTTHGMPGDKAEFDALAPADQDAVTGVVANLGKAIGAYERLLDCGPSRFDAWVAGDANALSESEQRGAKLFVGRGECVTCHSGPYFSDQKFHNVGLMPGIVAVVFIDQNDHGAATGLASALGDPLNSRGAYSDGDDGRLPESLDATAEGAFRTPTLRCVSQRPSFMHTGQFDSLEKVVSFFAKGGDHFGFPGTSEIEPLDLTSQDQQDLVAFMKALDGPGPAPSLLVNTASK